MTAIAPSSASAPLSAAPAERGFTTHDADSAPALARPFFAGSLQQLGFVPIAVARLAETPALLQGFFNMLALFERTSLSALEREVVIMAVARENGCRLCQALHSARLLEEAPWEIATALREGRPTGERRLDALTALTLAVLGHKGAVPQDVWRAFLDAGFSRSQALEAMLGIAATSLSTLANRLVEAPIDPPLAAFAPGLPLPARP